MNGIEQDPQPIDTSATPEQNVDIERNDAVEMTEAAQELDSKTVPEWSKDITRQLQDVLSSLRTLATVVSKRLTYDKDKEEAFQYLYDELNDYKDLLRGETVKPVFLDLILLFDRVDQFLQQSPSTSTPFIVSIRDEILELLARHAIQPMSALEMKFDPHFQRAIEVRSTSVPEEDGQIEQVVRQGFMLGDQVLRSQEVIVRKLKAESN